MKSKKIKDERIVQLNNKIQSEAYILITLFLSISIFIKAYIINMTISNYITELIVISISISYITIRGSMIGYSSIDTSKYNKNLMIFVIFGLSLIISVVNGIRNYSFYGDKYTGIFDRNFLAVLIFTFISSSIFIALILGLVSSIDKVGKKRLEKKLENDEE